MSKGFVKIGQLRESYPKGTGTRSTNLSYQIGLLLVMNGGRSHSNGKKALYYTVPARWPKLSHARNE